MRLLFLLTLLPALAGSSPTEYCRVDKTLRTDQCISLSSYYNSTTDASDFYILLSAKFKDRNGFSAFGTGRTMDEALMFVIYPGSNEGDVTVSVRTTYYHSPPEVSQKTPRYDVLNTWTDNYYHNAQLVCYSCDAWTGNNAKVTATAQSWIFSTNPDWVMQSDDLNKPLTLHTDYDSFSIDMTKSHHTDGSVPLIPSTFESGRGSSALVQSSDVYSKPKWSPHRLFAVHGLLLALAFNIMIPLGVAGIRSGHQKAFKVHWIIQSTSASIAFIGIGLGLYVSWGHPLHLTQLHGTHKMIGFVILLFLGLTPGFGYLHHLRFLEIGKRTEITKWHRGLGAVTLVGGWINVPLGLFIAGQPIWYMIVAFGVTMAFTVVIYYAADLRVMMEKKLGVTSYETLKS